MPEPFTITRRQSVTPTKLDLDRLRESGEFDATVSTADYIPDPFHGPVSLSHAPGAQVDVREVPLRVEHQAGALPAGRVSTPRFEESQASATITLSHRLRNDGTAEDIASGLLRALSVGAEVLEFKETPEGLLATRWRANEYSLVGEGADPAATVTRSKPMPDTTPTPEAIELERVKRTTDIANIFTGLNETPEILRLHRDALAGTETADVIRSKVLDAMRPAPSDPISSVRVTSSGDDQVDKTLAGIERAVALATSVVPQSKRKEEQAVHNASELRGASLLDLARAYLRRANFDASGLSRDDVARKALYVDRAGIVGHAAGDFANLLASNVNKSLAMGYEEAPETWASWTGRDSASDFRQNTRPLMSAFSDLDEIPTDGEYNYGSVSDKAENFTLATFGKLFSIGRKALVNDDLSAFGRLPRAMGRAASRKVGDTVYNILTNGTSTTMNEDGVALFHAATHSNLVASGAAPSVSTLNAAWTAMGTQTEPGGHTIQVPPAHIIVPVALQPATDTLVRAVHNPATASGVEPMPGYIGSLNVVGESRLDADSTAAWYLAASASQFDTVLVAFLDGIETPMIEEQDAPINRDGVIYKVRHDFTAYAGDWRTLYRNNGQ